jgi:hypothetical protein
MGYTHKTDSHRNRKAKLNPLTLNQRVLGSSPSAPTNPINHLEWWQSQPENAVSALCP